MALFPDQQTRSASQDACPVPGDVISSVSFVSMVRVLLHRSETETQMEVEFDLKCIFVEETKATLEHSYVTYISGPQCMWRGTRQT